MDGYSSVGNTYKAEKGSGLTKDLAGPKQISFLKKGDTMRSSITAILLLALMYGLVCVPSSYAALLPNPNHQTVYDTFLKVNWLADANYANSPDGRAIAAAAGITGINTSEDPGDNLGGSMGFDTAEHWLEVLNGLPFKGTYKLNGGAGLFGHNTWTIPRTPEIDTGCTVRNWAYNCSGSALGSLYYLSLPTVGPSVHLGFTYPDTTVPMPDNNAVGPFINFQPYQYWTSTQATGTGHNTFSFNTGWQGQNHDFDSMYVLPYIKHKVHRQGIHYIAVGPGDLEVSSDFQMVYDPDFITDPTTGAKGITWLADADLAKTEHFGLDNCSHGMPCIDSDGSMKHSTASKFIYAMNHYKVNGVTVGWLGQTDWKLPPADLTGDCDFQSPGCNAGPLGELFFDQFGGTQGIPIVAAPNTYLGGFYNIQPYLYWACTEPDPCQGPPPPNGDQSWSFSFGNGFQGTDIVKNNLYVMVYYPETAAAALSEAIDEELAAESQIRDRLQAEAAQINTAPNAPSLAAALDIFTNDVNSQIPANLAPDQAEYLIDLANATAEDRGFGPPIRPCSPHCT
jgi:hypothetical protein